MLLFYTLRMKRYLFISIALKEFKEIFRNPVMLMLSFGIPVVFFFILGFGISLDVSNIPLAIVDYDGKKLSREFAESIYNNRYFTLVGYLNLEEAERLLKINRLRAIVVIPDNFSRRLYMGRSSEIQVLIDGGYPFRADVIRGYISSVVAKFNKNLLKRWLNKRGVDYEIEPVKLDIRSFYNQAMKSEFSLIPGLFVIILLVNLTVLTSISIVREKDYGTIFNIYTSVVDRFSFITGKIITYWAIGIVNFLTLFLLSFMIFKLPFRGDFLSFLFISNIYIMISCLLGALISSFTKTMIAAQFVAMVVTIIPSFLYSGYLMPVSSLGREGRIEAYLFPAKYYMDACRGSYLKYMSISDLKGQTFILIVFCTILFLLSSLLFKKRER